MNITTNKISSSNTIKQTVKWPKFDKFAIIGNFIVLSSIVIVHSDSPINAFVFKINLHFFPNGNNR